MSITEQTLFEADVPKWMGSLAMKLSYSMSSVSSEEFLSKIVATTKEIKRVVGYVWWNPDKLKSILDPMDKKLSILRIQRVISTYRAEVGRHSEDIDAFIDNALDFWVHKRYEHKIGWAGRSVARGYLEAQRESSETADSLADLATKINKRLPDEPEYVYLLREHRARSESYTKDAEELYELLCKYLDKSYRAND